MKPVEVTNRELEDLFLSWPKKLYRDDPEYIMPLDDDIREVFDKKRNPCFHYGEAIRWILFENGEPVGRIAAFYHLEKPDNPFSGIGFFECVPEKKYAFCLFDTCREWLKSKNMTQMTGPVNFGDRDSFWGLMVSGFRHPSYRENYNKPYYRDFFESYGFEKMIEQSTSKITKAEFNFERISKLASRVFRNPRYEFRHFERSNLNRFAADFVEIYNKAWATHENFIPQTFEKVCLRIKEMLPIVPDELNWFVYADHKPAGFYLNVLDVNQFFKTVNGKFGPLDKLRFMLNRKKIDNIRGIVFGVIPEYHNLGLEVGMIQKLHEAISKPAYKHIVSSELSWVGDFNPKMLSMFDSLGAKKSKLHITYCLTV
jgi:hypothetical protein